MPTINELETQRDEIYVALKAWTEEQTIRNAWYQKNSEAKDELNRLIEEMSNGPKPTTLISMEAVSAEMAAKKVAAEPEKEIVEP